MKRVLPLMAGALILSGCTMSLRLSPQVPQLNSGPKIPMKVAVVVPAESRGFDQAEALPTSCFQMTTKPAPHGRIFVETVQGVLEQYFDQVAMLDGLPAPDDARLIFEATLTRVGLKAACLASPDFYATAEGTFRAVDRQGREIWRSTRTSAKDEEALPMTMAAMESYHVIMPKAMAKLASAWAFDLATSPMVRKLTAAERPARRAADASGAGSEPWWKQSGSDGKE